MGMNQATAIINRRSGEARVAAIAGAALSAPYRWQQEKSSGGAGGPVPQACHRGLQDYASGIVLAAPEFLIPRASVTSRKFVA